jgi:hypothetical protein
MAQNAAPVQNCPEGQNGPPAQEYPPICCGDGPAQWPAACCPPTLDTSTTKNFGYYLGLPRMTFYAVADGLALQRLPQRNVDLVTLDGGTAAVVALSTGDFNYDFQGAGRLLVGCTLGDCFQVEALYMRTTSSEDTESLRDTFPNALGGAGNMFTPFGNFGFLPITGVDYMNFAQIRYTSSLQEAELNLRRAVPMPEGRLTASVLIGVRYAGLPEEFDFNTSTAVPAPGAINNFRVDTNNEMVGPQVGALLEFYVDNRWWLNFEIKGAVMNNRAKTTTFYENVNGAGVVTDFTNSAQENHTAFAEDISLTLVYHWSPHLTTRLGYQAVFMQGLALAPENLGTDLAILQQGPAQLNHSGNVIYQGPVAGLTLAW